MFEDDDLKPPEDDFDANAWLGTYADAITLLLSFFILLYAISSPNQDKVAEVSSAMQNQLKGKPLQVEETVDSGLPKISKYDLLVNKLDKGIKESGIEGYVGMRLEEDGVVLQLGDSSLFDSGKAHLKDGSKEVLDKISVLLKDVDAKVKIEGHTDDVPMNNVEFKSNWELSLYRALNVLDYLIDTGHLDPSKYSAEGCGEYKPLVSNDTKENRAINRRVDIFITQPKD